MTRRVDYLNRNFLIITRFLARDRQARGNGCDSDRTRVGVDDTAVISHLVALSKDDVGRIRSVSAFAALIAELWCVDTSEEVFPRAEKDWGNGKVHHVDESGTQVLPDRCNATAEADVLTLGGGGGTLKCRMDAIGDKMKRSASVHGDRFARVVG